MKKVLILMFIAFISLYTYANNASELLIKAGEAIEEYEYEIALELYSKVIELEPNNAEAYFLRGIVNFEETDDDLALNDFDKAIELGFDKIDIYYHRGLAYESLVEYENALNDLTIYIESKTNKTESNLFTAYKTRGYCKKDLGDFEGAIEDYSKALEIDPKDSRANFMRALIYMEAEQFDKSISEYNKLLQMFPKKETATRKYIILAKLKSGNYNEALKDCDLLLQKNGKIIRVYQFRVEAYLGLEEYQLALEDINAIINDFPVHERIISKELIYHLKAKANLGLKNFNDAKKDIEESLKLKPKNIEYLKTKEEIEEALIEKK